MVQTFIGRNRVTRNSGQPTVKDALVVLKTLHERVVRVTAKSQLVLNPEDEELLESKNAPTRDSLFSKMAEEISLRSLQTHEALQISGMIYFYIPCGEVLQVLEGKPSDVSEALKHVVRDVRQDQLNFQLEKDKVHRKYQEFGIAMASTMQEWKIIRLMVPSEDEWKRLSANLGTEGEAKGQFGRRDSLVDLIEAKRPILERLGPDAKRIWNRRDAISTTVLSPAELRFFRQRHDMAKRALQNRAQTAKKNHFLGCVEDPEVPPIPEKIVGLEDLSGGESKIASMSAVSRSGSRISKSRSSILERLRGEENGFVETIDDIADFHEMSKQEAQPKKKYVKKARKRKSLADMKRESQAGKIESKAHWAYVQAIGPDETTVSATPNQDDFVTSLKLDPTGNCIAIGDSQGRIGIFDATNTWDLPRDPYRFYEEFVSHSPDFDTLYSRRIPRNVIALEWLKRYSQNMHLLASNEKTIKLWKLKEMQTETGQTQICPMLSRSFEKGHQRFFIHSISAFSDGELFLSADELALNYWHLERGDSWYKMNNTEEMTAETVEINRIITSAKACPVHCWRFFYATSLGEVDICDSRLRSRYEAPAQRLMCSADVKGLNEEVQRELECITDADFSEDGRYIVTKQFKGVQIWDLRRTNEPFRKVNICDTDPTLFDTMCTNGCLVDDFHVACNTNATGFVTGTYDNFFVVYDVKNDHKQFLQARHDVDQKPEDMPDFEEYTKKVLHVDWHESKDLVTVASAHSVYVYQQRHGMGAANDPGASRSKEPEESAQS